MEKNVKKEVFLIINTCHINIIKELKEKLLEFNINLNIYKKDDEFKRLLQSDTIVIFDNELILDYCYLNIVEKLARMNRAIHLYKLPDTDVSDIKLFFSIDKYNIIEYLEHDSYFLFDLILSLKTFKRFYYLTYSQLDKKYAKDKKLINILDYLLKKHITDKNKLKELTALSTKEFDEYYKIIEELYICKMKESQVRELLPYIYQAVFKKIRYDLKLNTVINELYFQKAYLESLYCGITKEEFDKEYQAYLAAVEKRMVTKNKFIDLLYKLEVIRIADGEIRNVLSDKDILKIKQFIETKFLVKNHYDKKRIQALLYLNYVNDFRIRSFTDFHNINQDNITSELNSAEIVISLVTKKALYDEAFLNQIRSAVVMKKKLLFVYLDKCSFNLAIQYLIGFSDDMCYWAYKRVDTFFEKYHVMLERIAEDEPKQMCSNIVKLK